MTKKEMRKKIVAANKRLQRLARAHFTKSDAYTEARADIARVENVSPFERPRTTLSTDSRMTKKELERRYRVAAKILKQEELTVRGVKKQINDKRIKTFEKEKGIVIREKQKFFDILKSDGFKKLSEIFGSTQILDNVREAYNKGSKPDTIVQRMVNYLKSNPDEYYVDELEDAMTDM